MKTTWMVNLTSKNSTALFEIIYLFFSYITNFIIFFSLIELNKLKYFLKLCSTLCSPLYSTNLSVFKNNKLNKYLNFKFLFNYKNKSSNCLQTHTGISKINYCSSYENIEFKFFNLFLLFGSSLSNSQFKYNHNLKFFSLINLSSGLTLLDVSKIVARWKDAYNLLINIFYYKVPPLIFGSPLFKEEILALNWNYSIFDINLWRYYFPFFIFKVNNYSKKIDFFFSRVFDLGVDFFVITDALYHFKNLHYLKKRNKFTLGIVNANMSPWVVNYPVITLYDSFLTQLFFFKLLNFTEKTALMFKYLYFKKIWIQYSRIKTLQFIINNK